MKRSDALSSLSRDHHQGLVAAQRLRRATEESAVAARDEFLSFFDGDGRAHFRAEEEVLLPALARYAPADHPAVVRVLVEHVDIRRRADELRRGHASVERLVQLGACMSDHVRHEERVLFPLIEEVVPAQELSAVAAAVERCERRERSA